MAGWLVYSLSQHTTIYTNWLHTHKSTNIKFDVIALPESDFRYCDYFHVSAISFISKYILFYRPWYFLAHFMLLLPRCSTTNSNINYNKIKCHWAALHSHFYRNISVRIAYVCENAFYLLVVVFLLVLAFVSHCFRAVHTHTYEKKMQSHLCAKIESLHSNTSCCICL